MNSIDIIAHFATVFTILSFASGVSICADIYKKGTTVEFSSFPFIAGVLCTSLWISYAVIIHDMTMIFVNAVGINLQTAFLLWYYRFTLNKKVINRQLAMLALFLAIVFILVQSRDDPVTLTGTLACLASLVFCASPMVLVADVIKTKSTEKLPFLLIFTTFGMNMSWFLYGYALKDTFVQLPNGIGALISGIQLSLFAVYSKKPSTRKNDDDIEEVLIPENGMKSILKL